MMAIFAPLRASSSEMPLPMPREPPVTIAIRLLRSMVGGRDIVVIAELRSGEITLVK